MQPLDNAAAVRAQGNKFNLYLASYHQPGAPNINDPDVYKLNFHLGLTVGLILREATTLANR
jgi:hypothetical protein